MRASAGSSTAASASRRASARELRPVPRSLSATCVARCHAAAAARRRSGAATHWMSTDSGGGVTCNTPRSSKVPTNAAALGLNFSSAYNLSTTSMAFLPVSVCPSSSSIHFSKLFSVWGEAGTFPWESVEGARASLLRRAPPLVRESGATGGTPFSWKITASSSAAGGAYPRASAGRRSFLPSPYTGPCFADPAGGGPHLTASSSSSCSEEDLRTFERTGRGFSRACLNVLAPSRDRCRSDARWALSFCRRSSTTSGIVLFN